MKRSELWDEESFALQQAYMNMLRKLKVKDLKHLHQKVFAKHKPAFSPRIPPWCPRTVFERRLFLLFAAKNYHLPKDLPESIAFIRKVKDVLTATFKGPLDTIDRQVRRDLNKHSNFSRERIGAMSREQVERYLTKLGYQYDKEKVSEEDCKELLWEYFNLPANKTWPKRINRNGETRALVKNRNFASPTLRQIIIDNPTLNWTQFCRRFGDIRPSTTHDSFRMCKSELRRMGYDIPKLVSGRNKDR